MYKYDIFILNPKSRGSFEPPLFEDFPGGDFIDLFVPRYLFGVIPTFICIVVATVFFEYKARLFELLYEIALLQVVSPSRINNTPFIRIRQSKKSYRRDIKFLTSFKRRSE